jgi:hypothetical protein
MKKREQKCLEAAQMKFLRHVLGITRIKVLGKNLGYRT